MLLEQAFPDAHPCTQLPLWGSSFTHCSHYALAIYNLSTTREETFTELLLHLGSCSGSLSLHHFQSCEGTQMGRRREHAGYSRGMPVRRGGPEKVMWILRREGQLGDNGKEHPKGNQHLQRPSGRQSRWAPEAGAIKQKKTAWGRPAETQLPSRSIMPARLPSCCSVVSLPEMLPT